MQRLHNVLLKTPVGAAAAPPLPEGASVTPSRPDPSANAATSTDSAAGAAAVAAAQLATVSPSAAVTAAAAPTAQPASPTQLPRIQTPLSAPDSVDEPILTSAQRETAPIGVSAQPLPSTSTQDVASLSEPKAAPAQPQHAASASANAADKRVGSGSQAGSEATASAFTGTHAPQHCENVHSTFP